MGPNGAGKTAILEAIYVAATSRSFRAPRLEACLRRGAADGFRVELECGAAPRRRLELAWSATAGRQRTLDGKSARLAEQLAAFPLLAWTQAESELVWGPPEVRRRFFDRGLVLARPAMVASLGRYERALGEKRALLAAGGGSRQLAAWNDLLARHGAEIAAARAALLRELAAGLGAAAAASGLALPELALRYRPSLPEAQAGEAALAAALRAAESAERARRQPVLGPHRDEIEILWDGAAARERASAGEAKALGLLLLAALARHLAALGREPALLVDDADAALDRERLDGLVRALAGFRRLVVSSSRPEVWPAAAGLATVAVTGLGGASGGGS